MPEPIQNAAAQEFHTALQTMIEKRYYSERSLSGIQISDTPILGCKHMSAGFMGTFSKKASTHRRVMAEGITTA